MPTEITVYDNQDTSTMIDKNSSLKFEDIGLMLPPSPPTEVISIRLPRDLINQLRSYGSQRDIPYQALIKDILFQGLKSRKKSA